MAKLKSNGDNSALGREVKIPMVSQRLPSDLLLSTPVFDSYSHDKAKACILAALLSNHVLCYSCPNTEN